MLISFITKIRMPEERGVSFAIASMCKSYVDNNQKVELVIPDRKQVSALKKANFWDYYQIKKGFYPIKKLFALELPRIPLLELIILHLRYLFMSWSFSIALLYYLWSKNRRIIHLFTECKEALILLNIARLFYEPMVIYEVHIPPQNRYEDLTEKLGINRVDLLITSNHNIADYYRRQGFPNEKIITLPNGINMEDFDFTTTKPRIRKKLSLPTDKFIVGYGGRFVTAGMEKGIPELIKAMGLLIPKYPGLFLVCVGGPQENIINYQKMLEEEEIPEAKALFLGHVPPKTLYLYMRAFDICAMPFPWNKHYAYTMAPLKMFEYMASGNPILATNLPSVREVLNDKENAIFAKPDDPRDLADKIVFLMGHQNFARKISRRAFIDVKGEYTWKKRGKKIISAISN